jgi:hypothetical protein
MAGVRVFPNPDGVLRHLNPDEIPRAWLRLTPHDRSLRGRYALIGICAGLHPGLAWHYALDTSDVATRQIEEVILPLSDERIEEMVRGRVGESFMPVHGAAVRRAH